MTQEKLTQTSYPISTLYAEASLAKAFQSLEKGADLTTQEELCSLKLPESLPLKNLNICCLRTYPDCYRMTAAGRLRPSLVRWTNWGTMSHGRCLTAQILESPNPEKECSLSDFLEKNAPEKYCLSRTQIQKLLYKRISGREGNRVYSADGLSITLTSQAGGFGGKTGLYEIIGLPIKSKTKSGYQIALPGDSIDLAYPNMNSRRGRVGKEIAHTLTTSCNQGYYALGIDMNPEPKVTELARCITARQDSGIGHHKGEKSGVFLITDPIAVLDPAKAETRQQGRRFKLPNEPMFTLTVTDRHGVVYCGYIRKLMPFECWRLQGFTDEQFERVKATGMSDAQLYKQAGNAVTTNVIEALAKYILDIDKENANGTDNQNF